MSRRQISTALYAAMPPETPSTTRRPASAGIGALLGGLCVDLVDGLGFRCDLRVVDLVGCDLLEADRQGLARDRRDLGRHRLTEAPSEMVELRVDVTGPARGDRDEAELRVDTTEELLDRGI